MDEPVRQLLAEHLPSPPPDLTEPPLAAIRRRARRRTGAQMAAAVAAVAAIATGTVVVLADNDTTPPTGTSLTPPPPETGMLYPTYLPPGYREDTSSALVLRYINPDADPPIPLVIEKLAADAQIPAEGPPLAARTVRGHPAEAVPIASGGLTLTWLENGSRFAVTFEAPPNTQIDFVIEEMTDRLAAIAEGLRPSR